MKSLLKTTKKSTICRIELLEQEQHYIKPKTANKTNQTNLWKVINVTGTFKTKTEQIPSELKTINGLTKDPEIICHTLNNFVNIGKSMRIYLI